MDNHYIIYNFCAGIQGISRQSNVTINIS